MAPGLRLPRHGGSTAALFSLAVFAHADELFNLLDAVEFRNEGVTNATDRFSWQLIKPDVGQYYYLEPQNVTAIHGTWGYWGEAPSRRPNSGRYIKFKLPPGPPPPPPPAASFTYLGDGDWNTPGEVTEMRIVPDVAACEQLCAADSRCAVGVFLNGSVRTGECWLDTRVAAAPIHVFCGAAPGQSCYAFQKVLACAERSRAQHTDLPGGDTQQLAGITEQQCRHECCGNPSCGGYVWASRMPYAWQDCTALNASCCFLKGDTAGLAPAPCPRLGGDCLAVTLADRGPGPTRYLGTAPASGIRSAVPLGGIGCGTVELRGDGSFSEWTIINQSPAGAAKIAEYPDALLAVRLCGAGGCQAKLLQTHPHGEAGEATGVPRPVDALRYSGAHPISRLEPLDAELAAAAPGLDVKLYAFSAMAPGDMAASARPAIAFTLALCNTGPSPANASLVLNMPLQVEWEQSRPGLALEPAAGAENSTACAARCNGRRGCRSWVFTRAAQQCQLQSDAPLNRYTPGSDSGVPGAWQLEPDGRCVTLQRPGSAPSSGNASLCAITTAGASRGARVQVAARAHSSVRHVLGGLANGDAVISTHAHHRNAGGGPSALQGAIQITSASIPPGSNATVTLTFGWNFPHRDHFNYNMADLPHAAVWDDGAQPYGNKYAERFPTARDAAWATSSGELPDAAGLLAVLRGIETLHSVIMSATALPPWLQDQLVNSVSHSRDSLWWQRCPECIASADPRVANVLWRQFEANDCPDLDSIHNDGERHLPYIVLWPDAERSKMAAWAHNQVASGPDAGMLNEQIHNANPDRPEGRRMGDGSTAFILEVHELLRWANDTTTLELYYPTIKRAVEWQIRMSAAAGVPYKLQTTYDILQFPQYDYCAYTSVFHMAAMAAAAELAAAMGDAAFEAKCRAALSRAQAAFDGLQWNEVKRRYDAASSGCATNASAAGCQIRVGLFSDTFYPQVLALSAGLGMVAPNSTRVAAHLASELKQNCISYGNSSVGTPGVCPVGMVLLTSREADGGGPTGGSDLQAWVMPAPDHCTLGIHLGQDVDAMLAVFEPSAKMWSTLQNNQWDTAIATDSAGYPTLSSHYGMHLVSWHIPLAMSGQDANLPAGWLRFAPKLSPPFTVPIFLPGILGTLAVSTAGQRSVQLTAGNLTLTELSVDGVRAPASADGAVHLIAGAAAVVW